MKLLNLLILTFTISCNIKEPKNYSKETYNPKTTKQIQKEVVTSQSDINEEQREREKNWIASKSNDRSVDDRISSIRLLSLSLSNNYQEHLSEYTKSIIRNEVFSKLEYFSNNIRNIKNIKVTKNHINTRRGKIKDLYIQFAKEISRNDSLVLALIDQNQIESTQKDLTLNFIKNIMEIKISSSLLENNKPRNMNDASDEQLYLSLDLLESANFLRNRLNEQGFKFVMERSLTNKLRVIRLNKEKIKNKQTLLQIQYYIDILLD